MRASLHASSPSLPAARRRNQQLDAFGIRFWVGLIVLHRWDLASCVGCGNLGVLMTGILMSFGAPFLVQAVAVLG